MFSETDTYVTDKFVGAEKYNEQHEHIKQDEDGSRTVYIDLPRTLVCLGGQ